MNIGYARVSTTDQNLELQIDALKKAGCKNIFTDKLSGTKDDRPGLIELLKFARSGDTIVVWKLDRLSRSLKSLISLVNGLSEKGISFISLNESIDTTSAGGKLIFHIFSSLAEFEREVIRDRTKAGLESAKSRGRVGGRPVLLNEKRKEALVEISKNGALPVSSILESFNISRSTYYRILKDNLNYRKH